MHTNSAEVCLVQKTLISHISSIRALSAQWPGPSYWSPALGRQGGVFILISEHFDGKVVSWNKDMGGRVVSLLLDLGNTRVNLTNIYVPANLTERKVFFEKLHEFFIPADGVIIGCDFNCY